MSVVRVLLGGRALSGLARILVLALATGCSAARSGRASEPVVDRTAPRAAISAGADAHGAEAGDRDLDRRDDTRDACPDAAEDEDGFEDSDGCPDLDDDRDGLVDAADLCPREAEDLDALDDADGCPEDDADRDRIVDRDDACPREAETYDGHDDDDGCPDFGLVYVDGDEILLVERIRFVPGTQRIVPGDRRLVTALVAILAREAGFRTIALDGIASDGDERRARLRAESVRRTLVREGIASGRLIVRVFPTRRRPDVTSDDASGLVEVTVLDPRDPLARSP